MHRFVWTDLATFDLPRARADYARLFDWEIAEGSYATAQIGGTPVAGLFAMPAPLAAKNLPSFWMSYISVADVAATVAKARAHPNAIIELDTQPADFGGQFALIRDPSGAGFTVYSGPTISRPLATHGTVLGQYHHCASTSLIEPFYADLFGWTFHRLNSESSPWPLYDIRDANSVLVAQVEELPEDGRQGFSYWIPCFAVSSLVETHRTLTDIGGRITGDLGTGRQIMQDTQGAQFMVYPTGNGATGPIAKDASKVPEAATASARVLSALRNLWPFS